VRIALLHHSYWPEVRRGTERFIRDLADGLLARGHAVTLITSHPAPGSCAVEDGLTVIRHRRPPEQLLLRRGVQPHLTHLPFAYRSLRRADYDVAHALYPTDALAAVRWSSSTGRPAILSLMGLPDRASVAGTRGVAATARRAAREAGATVALSRAAADAYERVLGISARVIAPGVDLVRFTPGGTRAALPTILCPAALGDPRKRGPLLLEAFALLRRERPEAQLVLSHRGALDGEGVSTLDLDDAGALQDAYRSAWVTVLPSRDEAFGLVLAESLACGTPVVGSASGAIPELIDRSTVGRLFDGDEPAALAAALHAILDGEVDPAACRARAAELSLERCVEHYEQLYRELS
jgi:glycosyltransferase involved in cell wall biosynthesis